MGDVTTLPRSNELTLADLEAMPGYGVRYELVDGSIHVTGLRDSLTRDDLDAMPEDGRRYELLDGVVVVSASPSNRHQGIVHRLIVLLDGAAHPGVRVRTAPFDVVLSHGTVLEPDVLVARAEDLDDRGVNGPPLLAIEVLSKSSRRRDLGRKQDLYAEGGCPAYWVIEPGDATTPPTLIAFELSDGDYVEIARVTGDESWTAASPFAITVVPNELLDD